MFTLSDLYRAFRDEFWPMSGRNPALTRRVLKGCQQHPVMFSIDTVSLAILAEVHIARADGSEHGMVRLYADPRSLERSGLDCTLKIGTRGETGRFQWVRATFTDGVGKFYLGSFIPGYDDYAIRLCPSDGTGKFRVTLTEPAAPQPAPRRRAAPKAATAPVAAATASPDTVRARAEQRVSAALAEADSVARAAVRRHLAKAAHPDTVPAEERIAFSEALGAAFGKIDEGRFALKG